MASTYGKTRNLTCPGCGMPYDFDARDKPHGFTIGGSFLQARRDIIAIKVDGHTGRTKYGRRNGTLGFLHETKMLGWRAHVDECVTAFDAAVASGAEPESLLESNFAQLKASRSRKPRNRNPVQRKRAA